LTGGCSTCVQFHVTVQDKLKSCSICGVDAHYVEKSYNAYKNQGQYSILIEKLVDIDLLCASTDSAVEVKTWIRLSNFNRMVPL